MAEREHPLLNNLVAKEILKYSTVKDLAAHRLVCKTWLEESLTRWRSTATLKIVQQKLQHKWVDVDDSAITLQELSNIFSEGEQESFLRINTNPFANYSLQRWEIEKISKDDDDDSQDGPEPRNLNECSKKEVICGAESFPLFWEKVGPLMRSLSFDNFEFYCYHRMPLLAIIFEHTPNLVALKFSGSEFFREGGYVCELESELKRWNLEPKATLRSFAFNIPDIPIFLEDLLGYFPNLENFSLEQSTYSSSMWLLLGEHRNDESDESIDERQLLVLPLKTLELGSIYSLDAETFVECISETLAEFGGLEVIKLYMAPFCEPPCDLKMTQMMESAKHFEVWGNWLESLGFLQWMPNLETLEVHISCFEKQGKMPELGYPDYCRLSLARREPRIYRYVTNFDEDIVQNALQSHPTMNGYVAVHLKSLYVDYEFGTESLNTLSKWTPHLKELKTILNNETLRTVCGLWSDLEKLDLLYGSSVDDEGITGINENKQKTGRSQTQKKANLTNLKKLKSFRLETYCGLSKLGDFSATEALLKMDTLQFLEICVSPEMSVDVEAELQKAIPNAKIIRNYGDDELAHREYGKCCKRREFLLESVEDAETKLHERSVNGPEIRRSKRLLEK